MGQLGAREEWRMHNCIVHSPQGISNSFIFQALARKLHDAPPAKWDELATLHGFRRNVHSILLAEDLSYNAASTMFYDWMHTWAIDGIFLRVFRSTQDVLKTTAKAIDQLFAQRALTLTHTCVNTNGRVSSRTQNEFSKAVT